MARRDDNVLTILSVPQSAPLSLSSTSMNSLRFHVQFSFIRRPYHLGLFLETSRSRPDICYHDTAPLAETRIFSQLRRRQEDIQLTYIICTPGLSGKMTLGCRMGLQFSHPRGGCWILLVRADCQINRDYSLIIF